MAPMVIHTHLDETTPTASSPTSSPGNTSDKENYQRSVHKRKTPTMAPRSQNKRRLTARHSNVRYAQSQSSTQRSSGSLYYDPDQDPAERRRVRKDLRELGREAHDSRSEWMQAGNSGIQHALEKGNQLFLNVKQTSDATVDSRNLVNLADMTYKKTVQLSLGDASTGLDVDEFVSKCITFMRRGPNNAAAALNSTQRRRGRQSGTQRDPNASDDDNAGDPLNWDTLGQFACFPYNARPVVPGWLLGPLSVQKRVRQVTQRRAAERIDRTQIVEPNLLQQQDLGQQESANLTQICSDINKLLATNQKMRIKAAEDELKNLDEPTADQARQIMEKHWIADDGGIPLFRFCINPESFGQSVENLFYVSFLVRDGIVGVSNDSREIPTLHSAKPYAPSEAQKNGIQKHQSVFSLDHETWEQIIDVFEMKDKKDGKKTNMCIIPLREETQEETGTSWQG